MFRIAGVAAMALIAAPALSLGEGHGAAGDGRQKLWPRVPYPSGDAIRRAQAYAAEQGDVSFAVIDPSIGSRGFDADSPYSSASVTKALLLAAELHRLESEDEPLDPSTKALLE